MTNVIKIKRGLNIDIAGAPAPVLASMNQSALVAISPDDFNGIVPKVLVKEGETVKAGTPIFLDKKHPELKIVAPVSGTIEEIARGERRKLLYISIRRDVTVAYESFEKPNLDASREELHKTILNAGFGAFIKQRPYDVVANPDCAPKAIFVSAFDSAPLAPADGAPRPPGESYPHWRWYVLRERPPSPPPPRRRPAVNGGTARAPFPAPASSPSRLGAGGQSRSGGT